jgi:hypothetical protein
MAAATLQAIAAQLGPQLQPLQLHLWRQGDSLHLRCRGNPLPEPIAVEAQLDLERLTESLPTLFDPEPVPLRLVVYGCQANEVQPRWQSQYVLAPLPPPSETAAAIALALRLACADLPLRFRVQHQARQLLVEAEGTEAWEPADLLPLLEPVLEDCAARAWQSLTLTWLENRRLVWQVEVPLIPLEERLRSWAHWGEAAAIARWLETQNAGWRFQRGPNTQAKVQLVAQPQGEQVLASQGLRRQLRQLGPAGVTRATLVLPQEQVEVRLSPVLPGGRPWLSSQPAAAKAAFLSQLWMPDLDQRLSLLCPRLTLTQSRAQLTLTVESLWPLPPEEIIPGLQVALEAARWPNLQAVQVCLRCRGETEPRWCQTLALQPLVTVRSRRAHSSQKAGSLGGVAQPMPPRRASLAAGLLALILSGGAIALLDRGLGTALATRPTDHRNPTHLTGNPLLDRKLSQTEHQAADVVIVGSSRALRGLNPSLLQQTLAGQGQPKLRIYNFGINGATAQVVETLVRHWIIPVQRPRLLLWLDGARAFNSSRPDQTFRAIVNSSVYRQWTQPAATRQSAPPVPTWLAWSVAYPHRQVLWQTLSAPFRAQVSTAVTDAGPLQPDGFVPVNRNWAQLKADPTIPVVSGDHDRDYADFRISGEQSQALERLLQFSQQHQVALIFVNPPLTRAYLDTPRLQAEAQFRTLLQTQEQAGRLRFLDYGQTWGDRPDYFSDPSHLNQTGATAFTQVLAQDARIAWPQPIQQRP